MELTRRKFIKLLGTASLATISGELAYPKSAETKLEEIKIAYPPSMAALPLAKGTEKEFFLGEDRVKPFSEQNTKLNLIPAKASSDAARLVDGGRADCGITGLASSLYAIRGAGNLKITSTAFDPNEAGRHLGLISSSLYEISSVPDLVENWLDNSAGKSIILSLRRDDHYSTDQLLKGEGYHENDNIYYREQEDLKSRLFGLLNGNFISTVLPEPLLSLSLENPAFEGFQANLLSDYHDVALPPFVFVFNQKVLEENPELVERFYRGWSTALEETNSSTKLHLLDLATKILSETDPTLRRAIENTEVTEEFANLFEVPNFKSPKPLDKVVFSSLLDWTISKGYLKEKIPFERAYDGSSALLAEESK